MTEEEQKILFNDLCARIPYGTIIAYNVYGKLPISRFSISVHEFMFEGEFEIEHCKPYLRPMSSMTEEEKNEFDEFCVIDEDAWKGNGIIGFTNQALIMSDAINWLNSHHFDYRDLIEKGLALEAPVGMYETEED